MRLGVAAAASARSDASGTDGMNDRAWGLSARCHAPGGSIACRRGCSGRPTPVSVARGCYTATTCLGMQPSQARRSARRSPPCRAASGRCALVGRGAGSEAGSLAKRSDVRGAPRSSRSRFGGRRRPARTIPGHRLQRGSHPESSATRRGARRAARRGRHTASRSPHLRKRPSGGCCKRGSQRFAPVRGAL
jgi:hypothetical protein